MKPEEFQHIRYEKPAGNVARIVLARPTKCNAQGVRMTYEINAAFLKAESDSEVNVIILAADGPHFSAGHDLSETFEEKFPRVGEWGPSGGGGAETRFADEMEVFLGMCERWRNLSKPTIALVQGKCIAGALMLVWVCDIIIASDDASFKDPTIDMGIAGVEYFMTPWELGTRNAKEFLFTADWLPAERARQLGMVNRVVPLSQLAEQGLSLALQIASKPSFAVRTAKLAINNAQDLMGRWQAMRHSFALHHLTHADNDLKYGLQVNPQYAQSQSGTRIKNLEETIRNNDQNARDWSKPR